MSNDPNDPNYDPYELSEETEYEENAFNSFSPDSYLNRRDRDRRNQNTEPIPQARRPRPSPPPFPQDPNAQPPEYPEPNPQPGLPAGDFANFNPDDYLRQRSTNRGALVNPNEAAPLQGFEQPIPDENAMQRSGGAQARLARSRTLRGDWDIMRDGEPLVRLGILAFFVVVGGLLSFCWIANLTLLFWYARR